MSRRGKQEDRIENDAYLTPPKLAAKCLETLPLALGSRLWEPHAGAGAFVRAALSRGCYVTATDVDPEALALRGLTWGESGDQIPLTGNLEVAQADFLAFEPPAVSLLPSLKDTAWIFGNPPYTDIEKHVEKAHTLINKLAKGQGFAFLTRVGFLAGKGRYETTFSNFKLRPHHVYMIVERPSFAAVCSKACGSKHKTPVGLVASCPNCSAPMRPATDNAEYIWAIWYSEAEYYHTWSLLPVRSRGDYSEWRAAQKTQFGWISWR